MTTRKTTGRKTPARKRSGRAGTTATGTNPRSLPGDLTVESRAIADLVRDPNNRRVHNQRNIDTIADAIKRFGQQTPIVIDRDDVIRKGNGTVEAMIQLGRQSIDVVVTELTGDEATAYGIADNRTSDLGAWDEQGLADDLAKLRDVDPDLMNAAGYTDGELTKMLAKLPDVSDGDPPPKSQPATRTLFLTYDAETHEWLRDVLDTYKERRGIDSDADAVIALISTATRKRRP